MKKVLYAISTLVLAVVCSSNLYATDYYVDPENGDDSQNGTSPETPIKTLNNLSWITLEPGDTIFLMDGVHAESGRSVLQLDNSGTEDAWITIRNYPGHTPTIKFDHWDGIKLINGASYIAFKGLKIQGAKGDVTMEQAAKQLGGCDENPSDDDPAIYNGVGINVVGPNLLWSHPQTTGDEIPHHILVEDCEIFDCTGSGVAFQQADYVTIRNNKFYDNCWYSIYGASGINFYQFINVDSTKTFHNFVTGNVFYRNQILIPQVPFCAFFDGNAIIVDDFKHSQRNQQRDKNIDYGFYDGKTLIANNVSVNNGGSGMHFFKATECYVINNTIIRNAGQNNGDNDNADIRIGDCTDFVVKNNLIISEYRLHNINTKNVNLEYSHNYQYGTRINDNYENCEGCITDVALVPFENEDVNAEFPYLSISDLIIDAGDDVSEYITTDFNGNPRDDGKFDIGAFEIGPNTPISVKGIEIGNCPEFVLEEGETYSLVENFFPANTTETSVSWTSSDTSILQVSLDGEITGIAEGEADITVKTDSGSFEFTCTISVAPEGNSLCRPINFSDATLASYGSNQDFGISVVEDQGVTLQIANNAWKYLLMDYEITEKTILEFDFRSSITGEFHGIGFDKNDIIDDSKVFTLHGTQIYGIMDFRDYSGTDWKSYVIPVGQYYTGTFDRITFICDHDIGEGNANSYFRNIIIHEDTCGGNQVVSNLPDLWEKSEIQVYPNPAQETVNIDISSMRNPGTFQLKVININGQIVKDGVLTGTTQTLNVSDLPTGLYHLILTGNGGEAYRRFMVE